MVPMMLAPNRAEKIAVVISNAMGHRWDALEIPVPVPVPVLVLCFVFSCFIGHLTPTL
jgi:hypothetical protein